MRVWFLLALAACEHGQTPAGSDATKPPTDADSLCSRENFIDGELIDWDSSDANFLGVFGTTLTQVTDSSVTQTTAPNGRLNLCASPASPFAFTLASEGGYLDGTLLIEPNALFGFQPLSLRTFTQQRASTFFAEQGLTFDPGAAQVVVLQTGDRASLTLSGMHDAVRAGDDNTGTNTITWSAGNTGRYVLFPNVTSASSVTLSGDPFGPRPLPVVAGEITLIAIGFVLE